MCFVENLKRKQRTQRQKGAFPAPNCQFFQIHGSKLKLDPSGDCGQASVVRITHCVLFFCVSKHSLNGLLAHRVNAFRIFCFSDTLHSIQIGLPDVSGQEFLTFLICPTFRFAGAFAAVLWSAAVDSFSILVRSGVPEFCSLWAEISVLFGQVSIFPGTVGVFRSLVSGIRQNRNNPVINGPFGNPWGLVAGIHDSVPNIVESPGNCGIQIIPCNAVMDIPGCYLNSQHKSMLVTGGMCFIGELPFVLTLYNCLLYTSPSPRDRG